MFRLIGFQCVITKTSAERAFHLSASLSLLDREEMRLELGDAEGQGLKPHLPQNFQGLQTKTKNKKRETMLEEAEVVLEKVFGFFVCLFFLLFCVIKYFA